MTNIAEWQGQVGTSWANEWQRTDRSFAALTHILVKRIAASGDARFIADIGCGAGELSIELSKAQPAAQLLGLDISADLIAAARKRAAALPQLTFTLADAAHWRDTHFVPDLYVSRHGVMFFDDPVSAFANLAKAASADARLIFSCFRTPSENEWARKIAALLPSSSAASNPFAPGPFAFADTDYVRGLLQAAGWTDITFEAVDFDYVAGAGGDPVNDALDFFHHIGPAARTIRHLDGRHRETFLAQLRDLAAAHLHDGSVRFAAAAWIVQASKG